MHNYHLVSHLIRVVDEEDANASGLLHDPNDERYETISTNNDDESPSNA